MRQAEQVRGRQWRRKLVASIAWHSPGLSVHHQTASLGLTTPRLPRVKAVIPTTIACATRSAKAGRIGSMYRDQSNGIHAVTHATAIAHHAATNHIPALPARTHATSDPIAMTTNGTGPPAIVAIAASF